MQNKLSDVYDNMYYVNLEGYERKRWELEFDRLYQNYLDKMEAWIGDRDNIKSQIESGLIISEVTEIVETPARVVNVKWIFSLLMTVGVMILLYQVFTPQEVTKEQTPAVQVKDN
ncbi:MAG: hypothetical protein AAF915_30640 [Cyanobacteria bacterium P01_D01_bin.50]